MKTFERKATLFHLLFFLLNKSPAPGVLVPGVYLCFFLLVVLFLLGLVMLCACPRTQGSCSRRSLTISIPTRKRVAVAFPLGQHTRSTLGFISHSTLTGSPCLGLPCACGSAIGIGHGEQGCPAPRGKQGCPVSPWGVLGNGVAPRAKWRTALTGERVALLSSGFLGYALYPWLPNVQRKAKQPAQFSRG